MECLERAREKSTKPPFKAVELRHEDFENWKNIGRSFFNIVNARDENGKQIKFCRTRMWRFRADLRDSFEFKARKQKLIITLFRHFEKTLDSNFDSATL